MYNPDLFQSILSLQGALLTRYAEAHDYAAAWGEKFVFETVKEVPQAYESFRFDPNQLKLSELKHLGFKPWSERGLYLIPLWLRPFLKEGSVVKCIDGTTSTYSSEKSDNDHRFGMLAYGVVVYEKDDPRIDPIPCTGEGYDAAAEKL